MPFKYFISLLALLGVLAIFSYSGTYYYETHINHFVKYNVIEQYILDNSNHRVNDLKLGQGFVLHKEVINYNNECFADYVLNLHNENQDYQFPRTITRDTYPQGGKFNINGHYVIPTDIPPGRYHMYQIAYPYCHGLTIEPFKTDVNLDLNIHE